jgi:large subunit ribosomal protein L29
VKIDEKLQEFRSSEAEELAARLKQARRELYELRFKLAVGQLEDSSQILKTRKDIARILTVIRQRELGEPVAEAQEPAVEKTPTGLSTAAGEAEIGEETEGSEETEEVGEDTEDEEEGDEDEEDE